MIASRIRRRFLYTTILSCLLVFISKTGYTQDESESTAIEIPVGGNSWLINPSNGEEITENGLMNWKSDSTICRTFFRAVRPGMIHAWLFVEQADSSASIEIKVGQYTKKIALRSGHGNRIDAGAWKIADSGYIAVDVRGFSRRSGSFGILKS